MNRKKQEKCILLSLDSLEENDLNTLLALPNFKKMSEKFSSVQKLKSIYPTLTYPIHTTMLTGRTPSQHGIFHNQKYSIAPDSFDVSGNQWFWSKKSVKCKTLVDHAHENNLKVGSFCFPVTAFDPRGINVPEIWPSTNFPKNGREMYQKSASPEGFTRYFDSTLQHLNWENNGDMVTYIPELALDCLRYHQPDLLLCHAILLDHVRHTMGNQNIYISEVLRQFDLLFGRFLTVLEETDQLKHTNFIILGDHGQIDITQVFHPNVLFAEENLLTLNEEGSLVAATVYGASAGFSCQILLNEDISADKVYKLLKKMQNDYPTAIERIYSKEEALAQEGLSGNFSFVLEGTQGTVFGSEYQGKVLISRDSPLFNSYCATHGHHPSKGDQPPLLAFGPSIAPQFSLPHASMLDIYPTCMDLLELTKETDLSGNTLPFLNK